MKFYLVLATRKSFLTLIEDPSKERVITSITFLGGGTKL
jgi:hypothetical protein